MLLREHASKHTAVSEGDFVYFKLKFRQKVVLLSLRKTGVSLRAHECKHHEHKKNDLVLCTEQLFVGFL